MKILIDIGHPAHVHYFKNLIAIMKGNGHEFLITARDKEITFNLLNEYKLPFLSRGKGGTGLINKCLYILKADFFIYRKARKFKPDLFLSFASTYAAHASRLYCKPHIVLDDTEHAKFELFLYPPFSDLILTPSCFLKDLGKKQIRFNSYTELLYLHKNYFKADNGVLRLLGVLEGEKFAIIRFVSWNASHDTGHKGLSNSDKIELVKYLANKMKVFVSSEGEMPAELNKYKFSIPVHLMHDALFYAEMYVGEGGTTASEAALLATPAIYMNRLMMGYIKDELNAGLLFQKLELIEIKMQIDAIINNGKEYYRVILKEFIKDKIDITSFLIWMIENYPKSKTMLDQNPGYQSKFLVV